MTAIVINLLYITLFRGKAAALTLRYPPEPGRDFLMVKMVINT